jgi:hypothetical protein
LTKFGSFVQIQLLWQWLTTCPHLKEKKENVITFAKIVKIFRVMACWKALRIFHLSNKIKKIQLQIKIIVAYPKSTLLPLKVLMP